MGPLPSGRRPNRVNRGTKLRTYAHRKRVISDRLIVGGAVVEFDRTLPFWRCYCDARLFSGCHPEVLSRTTELRCRFPCKVFRGVDVVIASTRFVLRIRRERCRSDARHPSLISDSALVDAAAVVAASSSSTSVALHIDTLHFVHHDAYKRGPGSEKSFHIQSTVLRDAPAVLQCVAGTMLSFAFLIYTSLHLVEEMEHRATTIRKFHRQLLGDAKETATDSSDGGYSAALTAVGSTTPVLQSVMAPEIVSMDSAVENGSTATVVQRRRLLRLLCPPSTSRVLILGMGGNSMALSLRAILGPEAVIDVVEVEPAVVSACLLTGTLQESDANTRVHLKDALECLGELADASYDFIFMDIFEPLAAAMRHCSPLLLGCRPKLKGGGLVVINDHHLPSAAGLTQVSHIFGDGNVQAVNIRGWNESVVVGVVPCNTAMDQASLKINKTFTDLAFNIYEELSPGWLLHYSWLQKATTQTYQKLRCRIWTS